VHDASADTLGARVRRAKVEKVPYVLVVGDDDVAASTVGVNRRGTERPDRGVPFDVFANELDGELASHR
jgi:threonyl-tRNA synthetase